jgi:hypothetical protein
MGARKDGLVIALAENPSSRPLTCRVGLATETDADARIHKLSTQ